MGAHDPFSSPHQPSSSSDNSSRRVLLVGFAAGVTFGVLVLVFGFLKALLVLTLGALGSGVAWLIHGVTRGQLDVEAAWDALRKDRGVL